MGILRRATPEKAAELFKDQAPTGVVTKADFADAQIGEVMFMTLPANWSERGLKSQAAKAAKQAGFGLTFSRNAPKGEIAFKLKKYGT